MMSEKKSKSVLRRRANEVRNYRLLKKLIPAILAVIAALLILVYVVSVMYSKFGSFTVSVNKYHALQYGLSLSDDRYFSAPTSRLNCKAVEEMTNIDGATLDEIDLGAVDGNDSGENYLCYTFYCKNSGKETLSYEYSMNITNMTMDIEKAVRIRLIQTYNETLVAKDDFARAAGVDEDGNSVPEPDTVAFFNKNTVTKGVIEDFKPNDVMKYTVVIWLEGNDPDCVDSIIGGVMKVEMKFGVTSTSDVDPETT
ncbi:MAG: hypothetical protein SPH68_00230 [Candidatus Borkfalkiaceae bacterium]|nr:hypothetical protein [Clostridia bacterium]MDY6222575.1 hypothetical protein [Christensenellaceae bacterium]